MFQISVTCRRFAQLCKTPTTIITFCYGSRWWKSYKLIAFFSSESTKSIYKIIISGFLFDASCSRSVYVPLHMCRCIWHRAKNLHSLRILCFVLFVFSFFFGVFDLKILLECGWRIRVHCFINVKSTLHCITIFGSRYFHAAFLSFAHLKAKSFTHAFNQRQKKS